MQQGGSQWHFSWEDRRVGSRDGRDNVVTKQPFQHLCSPVPTPEQLAPVLIMAGESLGIRLKILIQRLLQAR